MLESRLVRLRVADSSDADYIRKLRNSPAVSARFLDRWFINDERQAKFMVHLAESKDSLFLVAEDKSSGSRFGVYTLQRIDHRNQHANTGVFLDESCVPSGLHPIESACLLFDYAFGYLNLYKLCAEVLPDNARAMRYNEALGFTVEGCLKGHVFYNGALQDLMLIALFKQDFLENPTPMVARIRAGWGKRPSSLSAPR